jgi:hypothetical protein
MSPEDDNYETVSSEKDNDKVYDDKWTEYHRLVNQIAESVPGRVTSADAASQWAHEFPNRWVHWFCSYFSIVVC